MVKSRSIVARIIFSIITCGIYSLIWLKNLADDVNEITGNKEDTSGIMVLFLSIITCGIYTIYWAYKTGEKLDDFKRSAGIRQNDNTSILYLIIALLNAFTGGISMFVLYAIIQDEINKAVEPQR